MGKSTGQCERKQQGATRSIPAQGKHAPLWIWYVGTEELYLPFPLSAHINFERHITAQQSPVERWKESKWTGGKEAFADSMKQWRAGRVGRQTVAEGVPIAKTSMLRLWEG